MVVFEEEIPPPPATVVTVVTVSLPTAVATLFPTITGVTVPPAIAVVSVPTKDGMVCTVVGSIIIIVVVVSPKISQVNW